jgi:high-affinity Fe2+/Pb2+ permease
MKNQKWRAILWGIDAAALAGLVIFSVLGSLDLGNRLYIVGQIVCAVVVLLSVLLLRRTTSV